MAQERDVYEDAENLNDEHDDDLDERSESSDDEGHEESHDEEDERVVSKSEQTEEDDEREKIRARRREERKSKREAQKMREHILRSELSARDQLIERLSSRLDAVERRTETGDVAKIDAEINQLAASYVEARDLLAKGTDEQDGRAVVAATERMQQIRVRAEQLAAAKNVAIQRIQQAPMLQQQQIDPRLKNYAERWISENKWYDPNGRDEDSRTTKRIDDDLAREGWNANTPEYWDELTKRASKTLPHRFTNAENESYNADRGVVSRPKSVVAGSSRMSNNASSQSSYRLSPERVQAMKEAGLWDNPEKRSKMIAEYKRFDKENKT
jgi:cytochrome c556